MERGRWYPYHRAVSQTTPYPEIKVHVSRTSYTTSVVGCAQPPASVMFFLKTHDSSPVIRKHEATWTEGHLQSMWPVLLQTVTVVELRAREKIISSKEREGMLSAAGCPPRESTLLPSASLFQVYGWISSDATECLCFERQRYRGCKMSLLGQSRQRFLGVPRSLQVICKSNIIQKKI